MSEPSLADVVHEAVKRAKADESKPWDDCRDPKPRTEPPGGYCQTCGGMMIANATRDEWIHPPKGWNPYRTEPR